MWWKTFQWNTWDYLSLDWSSLDNANDKSSLFQFLGFFVWLRIQNWFFLREKKKSELSWDCFLVACQDSLKPFVRWSRVVVDSRNLRLIWGGLECLDIWRVPNYWRFQPILDAFNLLRKDRYKLEKTPQKWRKLSSTFWTGLPSQFLLFRRKLIEIFVEI